MYGETRNWRYFIGFGVLIALLFVIIILIVNHGNGNKGEVPETKKTLLSYVNDDNFEVSETIISPITASQNHDQVKITISNRQANFEMAKGYEGNVVSSKSYDLSTSGFGEFLSSIDKAGFTKGNTDAELKDDRGYCPTGQRYIFEAKNGSQVIERFWATSCRGVKTYKGNLGLTIDLFQAQVPDFNDLTNDSYLAPTSFGL